MDKNFNDQELSDIMKEIEALEENFEEASLSEAEVLEELSEMKPEKAIPLKQAPKAVVSPAPKSSSTAMSFKVHGEMNLEMHFDISGKVVSLSVSEHGLSIEMEGGVTFSVPVKEKKAA